MLVDVDMFEPTAPAAQAAKAFEKYDLVSAPVVDERGKLIGRVTIDRVMDYVRESSEQVALNRAGLRGAEDLFASVRQSVHNRWPWLGLNLDHGIPRVARHLAVRGHDLERRRARGADAHRRQHRRQHR